MRSALAHRIGAEQEPDILLDRFMPAYEVAERHSIRVCAPAEVTLAAAAEMDLGKSRIVRALFKCRESILRGRPPRDPLPTSTGLVAWAKAIGWGLLAEAPGREIVMGGITQPWAADVVFRAVPPAQFVACCEPDHVKIAWTLRADPLSDTTSLFRTETRVSACDAGARAKFRRYWRFFSPGIILIRLALLRPLKREAERRVTPSASRR